MSIDASRQTARLSHVSLWRDVYYTPEDPRNRAEIYHGKPISPVKLGADEYFVMGDNSSASSDTSSAEIVPETRWRRASAGARSSAAKAREDF